LVIVSDALFTNDKESRKSSQSYVIKLFGGLIIWKAIRQTTVITNIIKAKLITLSKITKKSMVLKRLFKDLILDLGLV
jgi:ABC-type polysaccharide/polyol phosphate export permease